MDNSTVCVYIHVYILYRAAIECLGAVFQCHGRMV